ncbi:MAG: hypothetical protein V1902_02515 [Candidatus Falkowbacteria bacterium]
MSKRSRKKQEQQMAGSRNGDDSVVMDTRAKVAIKDAPKTPEGFEGGEAVKVVLNGNRLTMDSATIPVQVFFSDALIQKCPLHVVLVDNNETDVRFGSYRTGHRYIFGSGDGAQFMQVHRSGKHRLTVLVFGKWTQGKDSVYELEKKKESGDFSVAVPFANEEQELLATLKTFNILAATVVEVEVPAELFAPKPKSRVGELIWKLTNRGLFYKQPPTDQCAYRKRRLLLLFRWPIDLILAICWAVIGILARPAIAIAWLCVWFAGYRPANLWAWLAHPFACIAQEKDLLYFPRDQSRKEDQRLSRYLLWKLDSGCEPNRWYAYSAECLVRALFAPWEITGLGIAPISWLAYFLCTIQVAGFDANRILASIAIAVALILFASLVIYRLGNRAEKTLQREIRAAETQKQLEAQREEQEKQELEHLRQWLATHAATAKAPSAVDLTAVQVYGSATHRFVRKWTHLKFWAVKRDVCAPYEK